MAQTTTDFAHGATAAKEARFSSPDSARDSRYFISPACPAAIHSGKYSSSGKRATAATPERSKPAPAAACFTRSVMEAVGKRQLARLRTFHYEGMTAEGRWPQRPASKGCALPRQPCSPITNASDLSHSQQCHGKGTLIQGGRCPLGVPASRDRPHPRTRSGMLKRRERFRIEKVKPSKQDPAARVSNFNEVYQGYTPEMAMEQAQRCLYCDHSPCNKGCPLHNDIPSAMFLLSQGDFTGAALKFMETSNFPDVCGRICPQEKQCEGACVLAARDAAVCIGKLEAFVLDYVRKNRGYPLRDKAADTGMRVGIVGAGPA